MCDEGRSVFTSFADDEFRRPLVSGVTYSGQQRVRAQSGEPLALDQSRCGSSVESGKQRPHTVGILLRWIIAESEVNPRTAEGIGERRGRYSQDVVPLLLEGPNEGDQRL